MRNTMKFNLRTPCKNCPFRNDGTQIRFKTRERAEEIEEIAYRQGFPCHLSAVVEESVGEQYYEFGPDTQHCAGFIIMALKAHGGISWPGINNDDDLAEQLYAQIDWDAPVFEDETEFFEANEEEECSEHSER